MSNQVYSNSITQYPIDTEEVTATNINAINIFGQHTSCNTLFINDPPLDNTQTNVLVWNFDTSEVEYSTTIAGGGVQTITNAPGVTTPIYANAASTSSNAVINGLLGDGNLVSLTNAPTLTGGSVIIGPGTQAVLTANTQTLTNKTMDSASNTITVTSSPISTVNINSLINQDLRTSANADFNSVTLGTLNTNYVNIYSPPSVNDTSNILALAGSSLVTRDNIVDTSSVQNITGLKTLTSPVLSGSSITITGILTNTTPNINPLGIDTSDGILKKWTNYVDTIGSQVLLNKTVVDLILTSNPPSTSSSPGTTGQIEWDSTHFYVCISTNTWVRTLLTTF